MDNNDNDGPTVSASSEILSGLNDWIRTSSRSIRENGWAGVQQSIHSFYTGLWRFYGLFNNYGTPLYNRDWDVLVVLDACRADLMGEVAPEYEFLSEETIDSVASVSAEWMEKNFTPEYHEEMAKTAHVTGNPFSQFCLDKNDFLILDEVWRDKWSDEHGTVLPDAVTDRGIQIHRERDPERMIFHYMQPHHPFILTPLDEGMEKDIDRTSMRDADAVWAKLQRGDLSEVVVWEAYRENLQYVLDYVELLLANIDAETVVITSDHGNAIGEYGIYGHPKYIPIKALKRVPWCVTSAMDSRTYEPSAAKPHDSDEQQSVEEKLRALGYM